MKQKYSLISNLMMLFLFTAFTVNVSAQGLLPVKGVVKDAATGETLIGVNILVQGTVTGTVTDINGNYSLDVPSGGTLVFSYIGYLSKEVVITKAQNLDVMLKEDLAQLETVVVIGYGVQKKTDKTGAISHVEAAELGQGSLTDPIQGLQGKAAGVVITKKGGDPNAGFAVKIRGSSGFDSKTQPLFVIDGIPNADPTTIAPEDIESYNILKDAASTAIYGSQGSNGVILITTKKGG
ncbi:MAG: carboxypeptidase-like regulatory domain-containing protein, partial [Lentimicrobiaceae bacterium]|nr:carboxypeptidase-like regulatory domain-containing protein [Lentimicrobiaceae bacterium]